MSGQKYIFTPEMDAKIMKAYREIQPQAGRFPVVKRMAQRLGIPRWRITRRAREIGALEPRIKEPDWSKAELRILERNAYKSPDVIQRHLKAKGYKRSITGIFLKRKRLRLLQNLDGYSANSLAHCLGVDAKTISRYIEEGLLQATKRGTARTGRQGGDIWYIREKDLKEFIRKNIGIIDIRKVEKFWFVELLCSE